MRLFRTIVAIGCLAAVVSSAQGRPEYCEQGETGDLPEGAENAEGIGELTGINGTLNGAPIGEGDFGDMYAVQIDDPENFRVRIVSGGGARPQLWLFAGDDLTTFPPRVGLLAHNGQGLDYNGALLLNASNDGTGIVITEPGLYYLAMTGQAPPTDRGDDGRVPEAKRIDAPDPPGLGDIFAFGPGFEISGPDGPSGGFPVCSWRGIGDFGGYSAETEGCMLIPITCPEDQDNSGLVGLGDLLIVLANWGSCPPPATCVFEEDFESYLPDKPLIPQQPCFPACPPEFSWQPYDGNPGVGDARVVEDPDPAQVDNVLQIAGGDDIVHTFNGVTSSTFVFTTDVYVQSGLAFDSFLRLQNTYTGAADENVSLALSLTAAGDIVDLDSAAGMPLVMDEWTELRVVIDLDTDTQTVYYNDEVLLVKSWTEGSTGGGALNVAGVRFSGAFANGQGIAEAFYDDITLCPRFGPPPCTGDTNGDFAVDAFDLIQVLAVWGMNCD